MPVFPTDYGGAVRVFNVAESLSKRGVKVILVSPGMEDPKNNKGSESVRYVFFTPFLSFLYQKIKLVCRLKYLLLFFFFFKEFFLLRKIALEESKTEKLVLQSEYLYSAAPLYLLKKIYGFPLIITQHNVEAKTAYEINKNKLYYQTLRIIEKFFLKRCDYIVAVSETDKTLIQKEYSIPNDKIVVIPNSTKIPEVTTELIECTSKIRNNLGINKEDNVIVFVGTLNYAPNLTAVKIITENIYPNVKVKIPNLKILIVGKGTEPKRVQDIIFTGVVEAVDPYLQMADVAIAPLTQGGGTRLKILEYMSFGKPVVSTSKGAEGLDIKDEENILISDRWDDFSNKVLDILVDPAKGSRIGVSGRNLVEDKYSWNKTSENYVNLYKKLLKPHESD